MKTLNASYAVVNFCCFCCCCFSPSRFPLNSEMFLDLCILFNTYCVRVIIFVYTFFQFMLSKFSLKPNSLQPLSIVHLVILNILTDDHMLVLETEKILFEIFRSCKIITELFQKELFLWSYCLSGATASSSEWIWSAFWLLTSQS